MQHIGTYIEVNDDVKGRHLPGIYLFLTHSSSSLRTFAARLLKVMGPVSLYNFEDSIAPTFGSWYKVRDGPFPCPSDHSWWFICRPC